MLSRSSDGGAGTGAGGGHGGGSIRGKPVGSGGSGEPSGSGGGFVGWYMSCLEANPVRCCCTGRTVCTPGLRGLPNGPALWNGTLYPDLD